MSASGGRTGMLALVAGVAEACSGCAPYALPVLLPLPLLLLLIAGLYAVGPVKPTPPIILSLGDAVLLSPCPGATA